MYTLSDIEDLLPALREGNSQFDLSALNYIGWIRLQLAVESPDVPAELVFKLHENRWVRMRASNSQVNHMRLNGHGFEDFDFIRHFRHLESLVFS